jgi:GTPase SAR1 family protein
MPPLTLRCAFLGPVSAGKSTLLNAMSAKCYSDSYLKRTTMVPQVYTEATDGVTPDDPATILARNNETNQQYWDTPGLLANETDLPVLHHTVPPLGAPLAFAMPLALYDIPGLDDGESESTYFQYLEQVGASIHVFVLVVDLVADPFNKSGSRRILDKVVELVQSHDRPVRLVVVVNKCDEMVYEEGGLGFDDEEHAELFGQVETVVADKCAAVDNLECRVVPLSAADAFVYRLMHFHPDTELPIKAINRIGLKETGRGQWNRRTEAEKRQWFAKGLQDADYEDRMKTSGFDGFAQAFREMVDHQDVQRWACDQFKDALAGLAVTPAASDSLTTIIDTLQASFFPQAADAHRQLKRIVTEQTAELVAVADDTYNKLERALALATRLERDVHTTWTFAHSLGDEWALFEADVNVCLARLATLAGTYPPHTSPFVSRLLKRLETHVRVTLLERHVRILGDVWNSPLATDELPDVFRANVRALDSLGATVEQKNAPFATYDYTGIMQVRRHHPSGAASVELWCDLAMLGIERSHLLQWAKAYLFEKNVYDADQWYGYDGRPTYHLTLETRLGHLTVDDGELGAYLERLETKTKWLNYRHAASHSEWPTDTESVRLPELDYVLTLSSQLQEEEYAECEGWEGA